jgi:hypothetical protein
MNSKKFSQLVFLTAGLLQSSTLLAVPVSDLQAPQLLSISLESNSIDASSGAVTQHVTVHATDNLSGLSWGNALYSNTDSIGVARNFIASLASYNLTSGTALDGIYDASFTIPQYAASGVYKLNYISLSDNAGNNSGIGSWTPGAFDYLGAGNSFQITSAGDLLAPQLLSISLGSNSIDASAGAVTQHVTVHATDNLSGLSWGNALFSLKFLPKKSEFLL